MKHHHLRCLNRRKLGSGLALLAAFAFASVEATHAVDPIEDRLFPPEVVMRFQRVIDLSEEQRRQITTSIQQTQSDMVDLQWRMEEASQALQELLDEVPVNETSALDQVDVILSVEREIKRAHLGLLIRIKNTLRPEQHEMLRQKLATQNRDEE